MVRLVQWEDQLPRNDHGRPIEPIKRSKPMIYMYAALLICAMILGYAIGRG